MDANGIFLDITVNQNSGNECLQHGLRNATLEQSSALVVDGTSASLQVVTWTSTPGMVLNQLHGPYCYEFVYVAGSKAVRDAYITTAQTMLGQTFRFGTGPVATPTA
jgi:hypothetical protein